MMFSNLLYFLTVIVLFSTSESLVTPQMNPALALSMFSGILVCYYIAMRYLFRDARVRSVNYFKAEKIGSAIAVLMFSICIYFLEIKSHLSFGSMNILLPSLVNGAGLCLFFLFLSAMWGASRKSYGKVFGTCYGLFSFIWMNIRSNLPIILPWFVISLSYDLLLLIPGNQFQELIATGWGDFLIFAILLLFVVFFSPPVVRRLWGCIPLPAGELKEQLQRFCSEQKFSAKLYLWPLYEGRVITAGVMGVLPGFRYVMLTPAIIENLTQVELESVMAHEIGHVKKYHLLSYVVIIACFSLLMSALSEPAIRLLFASDFLINFMISNDISPEKMFVYLGTFSVLLCMVLFFRFVFGYFIRNFERQADLYVFSAQGTAKPIISAFEKIAILSGNIRNKPSWHHFGIGERVDYLEKCEEDRSLIKKQDRKVIASFALFLFVVASTSLLAGGITTESFIDEYEAKYTRAYYYDKVENGSDDLLIMRKAAHYMLIVADEGEAIKAYSMALELAPDHLEVLNNLAWLLVTSKETNLRDPVRALHLAKKAVSIYPQGYVYDTLATAYWANNMVEDAVAAEYKAILVDGAQQLYYMSQAARFKNISYEMSL